MGNSIVSIKCGSQLRIEATASTFQLGWMPNILPIRR